ncbi:unnamed protein product [Caenorhabditis bovis]|uniref:FHA domain-containing protein n=1 Tax=Caenorhabditis bovis TaxID=2654633 RepID=A0A8S1EKC6_9PELO|nr:unnamed protein product [Caenorhabditis bovis]
MDDVFKSPSLPIPPHSLAAEKHIGLAATQREEPVAEVIDELETAEVELEKETKISVQAPILHYTPPPWACQPDENRKYQLEIVKDGRIVGHFNMENRRNSTYVVIGRIKQTCDLVLEHPSISRHHCILQYGEDIMSRSGKGWHIYELGSTHGSKMNKKKLPPKQYIRTKVGFIFQFGESSRFYNLLGPEEDTEAEWDCSPTEMKLKAHKKILEAKLRAAAAKEMADDEKRAIDEEGCNWGMDYGDEEKPLPMMMETDEHLMEDREAFYNQDPKKALAKFFEREGFDMVFDFNEQGQGLTHKWVCSIELPVEIDGVDRAFTASATVSTSKKDAQVQCALEACRILDSYGVLRRSNSKMRMKRKTLEENDYYDEDDDLYLDRTGQLEKQREKRKQWAEEGIAHKHVEKDTYESLCKKLDEAKAEIDECQKRLDELNANKAAAAASVATSGDALDDYVRELEKTGGRGVDAKTKIEKSKWRQRLVAATHELQKLEKLVRIAKPVELSGMKALSATSGDKRAFLRKMVEAKRAKNQAVASSPQATNDAPAPEQPEAGSTSQPSSLPQATNDAPAPEQPAAGSTSQPSSSSPPPQSEPSGLQKRVAEWENELEVEQQMEKEKRRKLNQRVRKRDIEKKIAGAEDYGVGCEDRDQKYATWMPPDAEQNAAKQEALRAKFAGKY